MSQNTPFTGFTNPSVQSTSSNTTQQGQGLDLFSNLNKDNIFSQDSDFYQKLTMTAVNKEEKDKPEKSFDTEKTSQLHNMLSLIGFQMKPEEAALNANGDISLDIAIRAKDGVFLTVHDIEKPVNEVGSYITKDGNIAMHYSPNGKYFLASNSEDIIIRNLLTGKDQTLPKVSPTAIGFSSTSQFFFFINKPEKDKSFVNVHDSETLEKVFAFESTKYKKENWPYLQFNYDDSVCVYQNGPNLLQFKKPREQFSHHATLELDYICDLFKLSQVKQDAFLATMSVEKFIGFNKTVSNLEIFSLEDLKKPVISTVMEKAQEAKMMYSPAGNHLLIWTQTTHDETGKSYYGEHNLYYFDMRLKTMKIVPTYEGPIHDVAWNPNGMEFVVISGFMPAGSVLFDNLCTPKFEFGKHHRNTIRWSPLSRFICLAGFGNLSGDMEIWDVYALKKVGTCKANSAVYCNWSPDGRKIMTGVLFPRLRVDNGVKIFKYNGKLLNNLDYSKSELYEAGWRPGKFEDRPATPEKVEPVKDGQEAPKGDPAKPKKLFQPQGVGMLSAMLKAGKQQVSVGRMLDADEDFGRAKAREEREKELEANKDRPEEKKEVRLISRRKHTGDALDKDPKDAKSDAGASDSGQESVKSEPRSDGRTDNRGDSRYVKQSKGPYTGPRREGGPPPNLDQRGYNKSDGRPDQNKQHREDGGEKTKLDRPPGLGGA